MHGAKWTKSAVSARKMVSANIECEQPNTRRKYALTRMPHSKRARATFIRIRSLCAALCAVAAVVPFHCVNRKMKTEVQCARCGIKLHMCATFTRLCVCVVPRTYSGWMDDSARKRCCRARSSRATTSKKNPHPAERSRSFGAATDEMDIIR